MIGMMRFTRLPHRLARLGAGVTWVLLGSVLAASAADQPAVIKADGKRIAYEAFIAPGNPFSPYNQASFSAGEKLDPPSGPVEIRRGTPFFLVVIGAPKQTFHTYPLTRRTPDQNVSQLGKMKLEGASFVPLWPVVESEADLKDEEGSGVLLEHEGPFIWVQQIYLKPDATPGKPSELVVKIRSQQCSDKGGCLWEDFALNVPVPVSNDPATEPAPALKAWLDTKPLPPVEVPLPERYGKSAEKAPTASHDPAPAPVARKVGLLASIIKALLGGFASLLTPCVFPMIPITVSIFLKKSEAKEGSALVHASVYSLTIVLVLTVAGLALLGVLVKISTHYLTNLFLGGMFIFFALSLLGMYEIVLPSSLANLTASREGKGSMAGTVFQALTFSILSFACVGPVFGGFIAVESAGQPNVLGWIERVLPILAFSVAFASPFFFLALFPGLIKTLPRSGSWMNSVKVVMGFLELAAAFKFLRASELLFFRKTELLTFDSGLAVYIALSIACALYLLNLYRLPHDHGASESIGVPRLIFSLTFLALALYLTPGLFKNGNGDSQRPGGQVFEWIESFLLSEPDAGSAGTARPKPGQPGPDAVSTKQDLDMVWMTNLDEALARAEKENRPIFFDFTGVVCTNCNKNHSRAFTKWKIQDLLAQFVLVRLYTDEVPAGVTQVPDARGSAEFRHRMFKTEALPYYEILTPTGQRLTPPLFWPENLITDIDDFAGFLRKALDAAK
jgi:thiol:disulfide interchange protein